MARQLQEIQELQSRLQEQAIRDGLTGLFNRRYLDETLPREISRAKRDGYPLAVIMMDIDHFKQINDTYGHPGGDEVLKSLGAVIRQGAREGDIACRYGGEEFVIVLPHMGIEAALVRAEKWRMELEATQVRHGDFNIRFAISAGVSGYPYHATSHENLIECADLALYIAKKGGRNQVICFEPPVESS
jgi:diguanylate cyclase (GGDEF)-like protein